MILIKLRLSILTSDEAWRYISDCLFLDSWKIFVFFTFRLMDRVKTFQNKAKRIILHANRLTCTQRMRNQFILSTFYCRRRFLRYLFFLFFLIVNNVYYLMQFKNNFILRSRLRENTLRDQTLIHLPRVITSTGQTIFKFKTAAQDWNSLAMSLKYVLRFLVVLKFNFKF